MTFLLHADKELTEMNFNRTRIAGRRGRNGRRTVLRRAEACGTTLRAIKQTGIRTPVVGFRSMVDTRLPVGDGLQNRTAWAAAGNGVLFYDPDNTIAPTEQRQYVFTEWDPTATFNVADPKTGRITIAQTLGSPKVWDWHTTYFRNVLSVLLLTALLFFVHPIRSMASGCCEVIEFDKSSWNSSDAEDSCAMYSEKLTNFAAFAQITIGRSTDWQYVFFHDKLGCLGKFSLGTKLNYGAQTKPDGSVQHEFFSFPEGKTVRIAIDKNSFLMIIEEN